jgi:hypothetical protein
MWGVMSTKDFSEVVGDIGVFVCSTIVALMWHVIVNIPVGWIDSRSRHAPRLPLSLSLLFATRC